VRSSRTRTALQKEFMITELYNRIKKNILKRTGIVVVCAWCEKDHNKTVILNYHHCKNKGVSHGICPTCAEKIMKELN
jgi:hypothetical protein